MACCRRPEVDQLAEPRHAHALTQEITSEVSKTPDALAQNVRRPAHIPPYCPKYHNQDRVPRRSWIPSPFSPNQREARGVNPEGIFAARLQHVIERDVRWDVSRHVVAVGAVEV